MSLHLAMLYGDWLRAAGRGIDALQIWRMVIAHPQADAGMRTQAIRWSERLATDPSPGGHAEPGCISLSTAMDRLLAGNVPGGDPEPAKMR